LKKTIEITSEAYSDIRDAISFYEKVEIGAGKYFFNEIDELTLSCGFHPFIFKHFRYTCKKFLFLFSTHQIKIRLPFMLFLVGRKIQ
jgi:hypothetical protein